MESAIAANCAHLPTKSHCCGCGCGSGCDYGCDYGCGCGCGDGHGCLSGSEIGDGAMPVRARVSCSFESARIDADASASASASANRCDSVETVRPSAGSRSAGPPAVHHHHLCVHDHGRHFVSDRDPVQGDLGTDHDRLGCARHLSHRLCWCCGSVVLRYCCCSALGSRGAALLPASCYRPSLRHLWT